MSMKGGEAGTDRLQKSAPALLAQAAGSPRDLLVKLMRFGRALRGWRDLPELDAKLQRLVDRGYVTQVPTRVQLIVGSADMVRFWITPAAADYYADKGINFTFHQILRVLDDPASMIDPLGLMSERDTIIGHVLQVVHANPCYDLQLLDTYPDGLAELERQTRAMIDGTHPRTQSIGAIVEDPEYHGRLLDYVVAFRADPTAAHPPIRSNVAASEKLALLERTFGTLPAAMRYFTKLPTTARGAARHLVTVRSFPAHLAEPADAITR